MSPAEFGRHLARQCEPISDDVAKAAARILAGVEEEDVAA